MLFFIYPIFAAAIGYEPDAGLSFLPPFCVALKKANPTLNFAAEKKKELLHVLTSNHTGNPLVGRANSKLAPTRRHQQTGHGGTMELYAFCRYEGETDT